MVGRGVVPVDLRVTGNRLVEVSRVKFCCNRCSLIGGIAIAMNFSEDDSRRLNSIENRHALSVKLLLFRTTDRRVSKEMPVEAQADVHCCHGSSGPR